MIKFENNIALVVYTNEKYLPIADLTIGEFDKHSKINPLKRYLISNKFTDYEFKNNNFIKINSNVEFDGAGNHFGQTMSKALTQINEEYILFFCDDYLLIERPDFEKLNYLFDIIVQSNIDFFSFASMNQIYPWKDFESNNDLLGDIKLFYIPENYQYKHSVQPCIWKKNSLIEILTYNPNLPIHHLDTTCIKNKNGIGRPYDPLTSTWGEYLDGVSYAFKCVCTNVKAYDDVEFYKPFIFPYVEIMRHGFFNFWQETNTKRFFKKFIEEKNIENDQYLNKFIP